MTSIRVGRGLSYVLFAALAMTIQVSLAQQPASSVKVERVEITGSNIPRTAAESPLPIQTITREEIQRSGITTATELVDRISANASPYNPSQALGDSGKPGFSGASLRGLGASNTLVLLNGRRIANYAFDSGAVDLNSIPLSAIERVEVLLDGASAVYGTDAIGGVINFITRTDFRGAEVTAFVELPRAKGGDKRQLSLAGGLGDLQKDRFNFIASFDYQKSDAIRSADREFSKTAYLPQYGVNKLSSQAFPANILTATGFTNPALATGCLPPLSFAIGDRCRYNYASRIDIVPPQEKTSLFASGTLKVAPDMQFFGEINYVKNIMTFAVSETPVSEAVSFTNQPLLYPAGGPFYPTGLGLAGDLNLYMRTIDGGLRTDEATSKNLRAVAGIKGLALGWDYNAALSYNKSQVTDRYTNGWLFESKFYPAMFTGLINPFGPQTAAGQALIDSTKVTGVVRESTGKTPVFDVRASRELTQLAGGPLAIAMGAEIRSEKFIDDPKPVMSSGDILGGGGNQSRQEGSRDVKALFAELSIPILKNLEGQLAARMDKYSDVGTTTNPKVGFKWTPHKVLAFRGSYNTGFHAPTLFDLHGPVITTNTANIHDDPVRCPGGVALNPATTGQDCAQQFNARVGGNPQLTPEESKQFSLGIIAEPVRDVSITVDYYNIERGNTIGTLSDDLIFGNYAKYSNLVARRAGAPGDPAGLPGIIDAVNLRTRNLGKIDTQGLDISAKIIFPRTDSGQFRINLHGNRVLKYKYQVEKDGEFFDNLGQFAFVNDGNGSTYRIIPTWRHYLAGTWDTGRWGITLANSYTSSYRDANDGGQDHRVEAYSVWDLYANYRGIKNLTLMAGVRNLGDVDPSFSNQGQTFQVGYEPKIANPAGRSIFVKAIWKFL